LTAYVGLLKFNESPKRDDSTVLTVGRTARAIASVEGHGDTFLSILWSEGEYDMVLTLETTDQGIATSVFEKLAAEENATVTVLRALVGWEKKLAIQGKSI